jgi:ornithine cyclodeaminase/alanine dehydrogenase-like protein (mu-crystallin family)
VKSTETVVYGRWLKPGCHVNSVGTARRDQREIDPETFARSAAIVVDTKEGVLGEAGDAVAARDVLETKQVDELSALVVGKARGRASDSEITLFKSVGTGIQDIALAAVIYQRAKERGLGTDIGEFPYLKRQ